jgi:hypothetical protein
VGKKKRIEGRAQVHASECDRRRDPQRSDQLATALAHIGGRFLDIACDPPCAFEKCRPIVSQGKLARCPMQQDCSDLPLQLGKPLADDGFRQTQASGGLAD